jgi:hypothetical protein
VYVVWSDCRFAPACAANDLLISVSDDGVFWQPPLRVPIEPVGYGVHHAIPSIAIDPATSGATAHIALTYYFHETNTCATTSGLLFAGFVSSLDGGATWSRPITITPPMEPAWLPLAGLSRMVGDYTGISFAGGMAFPIIAVAKQPAGAAFDQAIYTIGLDPANPVAPELPPIARQPPHCNYLPLVAAPGGSFGSARILQPTSQFKTK